jgi:hypothetical protein
MAGGDRTKWQYFLDMTLVEFLNAVSFHNEKQRTKAERLQKAAQEAKSSKDNNVYLIALLQEMV